jgi:hypothetical protein
VSYKIKAEVEFPSVWQYDPPSFLQAVGITDGMDLIASLSYERYFSDGNMGLFSVSDSDEAPGLVRFRVFSVSLSGRF